MSSRKDSSKHRRLDELLELQKVTCFHRSRRAPPQDFGTGEVIMRVMSWSP